MSKTNASEEKFEIRDMRNKDKFVIDDKFLNGYAKVVGIYATGVYMSLCRHADKAQKSFPSVAKIAEELNISRRTVFKALKKLEACNIIKRIRTGKQLTNRYILTSKRTWKIKDWGESEVHHMHITKPSDVHQVHITGAPGAHPQKGNTIERKGTSNEVPVSASGNGREKANFDFNEYLKEMMTQVKHRHIHIIALYFKHKGYAFENYEQTQSAIKRNLRAAKDLVGYPDHSIRKTMKYLETVDYISKWTLETVVKFIDEVMHRQQKDTFIPIAKRVNL